MSKEQTESQTEETALVKTGVDEFSLEKNKAVEIAERFLPNIEATKALNTEFQAVIAKEINEETVKEAKALRLRYVKLRTGTAAIHKTEKNAFLNGGRFVDSCKSAQLLNGEPCETKLKAIEDHFETLRKEAVDALQAAREVRLVEYGVEVFPSLLGEMEDVVWDNYINGVKLNFEAKQKEAAEAEALRVKAEEEAKVEQERIRQENEKLKAEAAEREAAAKKEQEARDKAEAARIAKEKKEQDKRDAQAKKEQDARDAAEAKRVAAEKKAQDERDRLAAIESEKVRKAQEEAEAKLADERKERARIEAEAKAKQDALEAELQAKRDAEALALKQAEEAKQAELAKGDGDKIVDMIDYLLDCKFEFKSKKNQKLFNNVALLCGKIVKYIEEQTKA